MSSVSMPVFKPIAAHDLPLIVDIELRSHSHPWTAKNFSDALNAGYLALGLWRDTELLAYAWVMRAADEAELLDITVAPEHRRVGHAKSLLAEIESRLRHSGTTALFLEVRASNTSARALYALHGFEAFGVRTGYYPSAQGREDAIMMKKVWHGNAG